MLYLSLENLQEPIIYAAGNPYGVAVAQNGDLFVADDSGAKVIRIDVMTGVSTVVSSGDNFVSPQGVAVAANGDLLVVDGQAFETGAVIHVNPTTGIQTVVSQGDNFVNPYGIALEADGSILVVDPSAFDGSCPAPGCGGVIRVNPMTGTQTIVSSSGVFRDPAGAAVHPNGDIFVVDGGGGTGGGVIRVNPTTGEQTWISNHGLFGGPQAIALEADGNILVVDPSAGGGPAVIRVNPTTGEQTVVSQNDNLVHPRGVVVAPITVTKVTIDIKPGSFPNSINPRSNGVIPVAILTTSTFDATMIDALSVKFGPEGATESHGRGHIEDVDSDGDLDLVLHFRTQDTGIQCGNTSASLTGETLSGAAIEGSDLISTVGCK